MNVAGVRIPNRMLAAAAVGIAALGATTAATALSRAREQDATTSGPGRTAQREEAGAGAWGRLLDTSSDAVHAAQRGVAALDVLFKAATHQPLDWLRHQVAGPPPADGLPDMKTLAAKFPDAGIPARIQGTSIDHAVLRREGAESLIARAAALGMNTIRYGPYWNDVARAGENSLDFRLVDELLDAAQRHGIRVIFTVGAKAPSWPEHHIPTWAQDGLGSASIDAGLRISDNQRFVERAYNWTRQVTEHVRDHPAIAMWQVENEPYQPAGPEMTWLSDEMVRREVELVRQLDGGKRPIMINLWSESGNDDHAREAFAVADVVGIDVYPSIPYDPANLDRFGRTTGFPSRVLDLSRETGKPAMVAELQAENWGSSKVDAAEVNATADWLEQLGYRDLLYWRLQGQIEQERAGDTSITEAIRAQVAESFRDLAATAGDR